MAITRADVLTKIPAGKRNAPSVPTSEILELVFGTSMHSLPGTVADALKDLDREARALYSTQGYPADKPSDDALKNCHGKWSEPLFAITAWNTLAGINSASDDYFYVYVKLPPKKNKKTEWLSLLNENCSKAIRNFDLDSTHPVVAKSAHTKLTLIASNPDAVILKFPKDQLPGFALSLDPSKALGSFDVSTLEKMDTLYESFIKKVTPSANLVCFVSLKTSTRPDRKYQFLNEGNHVKSVLMYLYAMKADKGLTTEFFSNRYFAVCLTKVTDADREAMDCAMSAYISAPMINPLWSVDKLYESLSFTDIPTCVDDILTKAKF